MSILDAFKADPQKIKVAAEQKRLDEQARLDRQMQELDLDLLRTRAKATADRERRRQADQIREEQLAARTERAQRARQVGQNIGRRGLITGPILAPMVVAWIGQIGFALDVLGWWLIGAIGFAAAWELTTAFCGWMYHQARQDGDRGTVFRIATWLFAGGAGAMNYWHSLDGHAFTSPTPKAVSFGVMSLTGIALWELYALLIHRKALRAAEKLPEARPKFGLARWLRFPRLTFTAWSLSIRDELGTTSEAWGLAVHQNEDASKTPNPLFAGLVNLFASGLGLRIFGREVLAIRVSNPPVEQHAHTAVDLSRVVDLPTPKLRTSTGDLWWLTRSQTSAQDPSRSESHPADRSADGSDTQVPTWVLDLINARATDPALAGPAPQQTPDRPASEQVQANSTQTGPKKQTRTRTKPLDRIDEAKAVDASYFADHGRHIPAEKLARAMEIGKPAALELVKQVRGAHMDIAK